MPRWVDIARFQATPRAIYVAIGQQIQIHMKTKAKKKTSRADKAQRARKVKSALPPVQFTMCGTVPIYTVPAPDDMDEKEIEVLMNRIFSHGEMMCALLRGQ